MSDLLEVLVPDIGNFDSVDVIEVLVKAGDVIAKEDSLITVESDKASMDIPSAVTGTVKELKVKVGDKVAKGSLILLVETTPSTEVSAKKEVIEILRQRSRPYLFSNSLAPAIVGASIKVFELLEKDTTLRDKVEWNTNYFKEGLRKAGIDFIDGDSAIVPVMLYDAKLSQIMADELLKKGIYVIGFFFPVVPRDKARIRVQLSAAHSKEHLDKAIAAFTEVGKMLNIEKKH